MMSGEFKPKTKVMALGYISKVQRNVNLKCFIRFRIHSFYFQTLNFWFNEVPQLFMAEFMYKQKTLLLLESHIRLCHFYSAFLISNLHKKRLGWEFGKWDFTFPFLLFFPFLFFFIFLSLEKFSCFFPQCSTAQNTRQPKKKKNLKWAPWGRRSEGDKKLPRASFGDICVNLTMIHNYSRLCLYGC